MIGSSTHNPYANNPYAVYEDRSMCQLKVADEPKEQVLNPNNSNNIYVSNLLPELDEKWLRAEFSRFGLITSAKVMTKNGVSKGYGFVQFTEPDMACAAVQALNGSYVGDHCISCKLADHDKDRGAQNQPSNNLYIGNLPTQFGVGEVSELFGRYGPISSLVVLSDPVTGGSRGVSLVRYHTVEDSTRCIEGLNGVVLEGHDRPLEVKYAETSNEKHMRKSGKKRNVAAKRAANPRNRGRTTGEPRADAANARNENSPTSGNGGRSSSNSSASNGTPEIESPVSFGTGMAPGPAANPRFGDYNVQVGPGPSALKGATAFKAPAMQAMQGPALQMPHPFLLRHTPPIAPLCPHPPPMVKPAPVNVSPMLPHMLLPNPQPMLRTPTLRQPTFPPKPIVVVQPPPSPAPQPLAAADSKGAVLKVSGLPRNIDELALYQLFTPFGAVESVTIPNVSSGANWAFIRFRHAKDAAIAMNHLQGAAVLEHTLKVAVH